METIDAFVTISEPKNHKSIINGVSSFSFSTEVDLVRSLSTQNINLNNYDTKSEGDEKYLITTWILR